MSFQMLASAQYKPKQLVTLIPIFKCCETELRIDSNYYWTFLHQAVPLSWFQSVLNIHYWKNKFLLIQVIISTLKDHLYWCPYPYAVHVLLVLFTEWLPKAFSVVTERIGCFLVKAVSLGEIRQGESTVVVFGMRSTWSISSDQPHKAASSAVFNPHCQHREHFFLSQRISWLTFSRYIISTTNNPPPPPPLRWQPYPQLPIFLPSLLL